ncbi:ryncolin-1-like [Porites lutea]|uniref:ryncolin-1-like n=1 Tax=Porites lutea TaxID=51062 RepID=UPI003CC5F617
MSCISVSSSWSLLILLLFVNSHQTFAKPAKRPLAGATTVPKKIQHCNNVYFYEAPNEKIATMLKEIKEQLVQVQTDISEKIGNKTNEKGEEHPCQYKLTSTVLKGNKTNEKAKKNCAELYKAGERISSVYTIDPDGQGAFDVFCDQTTTGGGWTVFQKRLDGSVDFYRGWADYKRGFGNLNGEFWLGLDKIHRLTKSNNRLRVDLEDTTGKTAYAEYDMFAVTSERTKYQLSLGTHSGTAGDSFSGQRGQPFTTKDQDNDSHASSNCAVSYKGAWWYTNCQASNLNGLYHHGSHSPPADGVSWYAWKGHYYSAKRAEMKIRPVNF